MATSGLNTLLGDVVGAGLSISPTKRRKQLSGARDQILGNSLTINDTTFSGNAAYQAEQSRIASEKAKSDYEALIKSNQASPNAEATPTPEAEAPKENDLGYNMSELFKTIARPVNISNSYGYNTTGDGYGALFGITPPTTVTSSGSMYTDKEFEDYIMDNYYPDATPFDPLFNKTKGRLGVNIDKEIRKGKDQIKATIADKSWQTSGWYTKAKSKAKK